MRYVDIETTGMTPDDEILSLAILDEIGLPLLNTFIKPTRWTSWPGAEKPMEFHRPLFSQEISRLQRN